MSMAADQFRAAEAFGGADGFLPQAGALLRLT
jgi:hypothetical protein